MGDYERALKLFYSYAGKELTFEDLTDELVDEFLSDCLSNGAALPPATSTVLCF